MNPVALERLIFDEEHDSFRDTARAFAEREVAPFLLPLPRMARRRAQRLA